MSFVRLLEKRRRVEKKLMICKATISMSLTSFKYFEATGMDE